MNRKLLLVSILFSLGIFFTSFVKSSPFIILTGFFIFLIITITAFLKNYSKIRYLLAFDFILAGFLFGQIALFEADINYLKGLENIPVTVEGTAEGDSLYRNENTSFNMKISRIYTGNKDYEVCQKVRVLLLNEKRDIFNGDRLSARGILMLPSGNSNPGEFSYRDYLLMQGIHHIMRVESSEDVVFYDYRDLDFFSGITTSLREYSLNIINKLFDENSSSLLAGIVMGSRKSLPDKLTEDFRTTGTFHIVAASGSNISVLLLIIFFSGLLLKISYRRIAIFCIPVIIIYAFIAGGQPSIMRASIMGLVVILGLIIEREPDLLTSLFGAAFLLLIINPLQLYDAGFQLSFATVLSIVYFTPPLRKILRFIPSAGLRDCLSVSLAAQLGIGPVVITYFNQLSLISVIANLLIFLFTGFSLILGVIMILLYSLLPFAGVILSRIVGVLLDYIIFIVTLLSKVPFASVNLGTPPPALIFLYYCIIIFIASLLMDYIKWKEYFRENFDRKKLAILITVVILFIVWYPLLFPPLLEVTFLDVGQGDCIFLKLPGGSTFLIDGGRGGTDEFDQGKMVVAPFLKKKGISRLTGIFLTHCDNDHMGGLLEILKEFRVDMVFDGLDYEPDNNLYREFLYLVNKNNSKYYRLSGGSEIFIKDGVLFEVFNPSLPLAGGDNHLNENSLVVRVSWKDISFLMTGDVGIEGEMRILDGKFNIDSDILKVSHHGSKSSSSKEFLDKVTPEVSIIGVGEKNPYGHPSPSVLKRLQTFSPYIYRTDIQGAITVITDGKDYRIETVK